jgi:hypothetical protein
MDDFANSIRKDREPKESFVEANSCVHPILLAENHVGSAIALNDVNS